VTDRARGDDVAGGAAQSPGAPPRQDNGHMAAPRRVSSTGDVQLPPGRGLPDGLIFWSWMGWYAVGRFALGFLRIGEPNYAFGLREDQAIGVLVLAAAIPMLIRLWPRGARAEVAAP